MNNHISIDICVCTFRRDHIIKTLHSLCQIYADPLWDISIIVADNNEKPEAREKILSVSTPFPVQYIHAPACNISIARNACLENSNADFLAFIDDDELANSVWIKSLVETAEKTNAKAILGSVQAVYEEDTPIWMTAGDYHSTHPVWVNGEIITGYTCNLLIDRRSEKIRKMRFKIELGRTGGEDTVFLSELYRNGGKISYADKATINEPVTKARASLSWLIKRRYRSGQTHALLLLMHNDDTFYFRVSNFVKASMKACFCFTMALLTFLKLSKSASWILRGSLHLGVMARLLGQNGLVQYGN